MAKRTTRKTVAGADSPPGIRRKLVAFDSETWQALDLLGRDSFTTFQELADEAFRDLLRKHGRPVELRDALKKSARGKEEPRSTTAKRRRE
jgi:hypothetical protein